MHEQELSQTKENKHISQERERDACQESSYTTAPMTREKSGWIQTCTKKRKKAEAENAIIAPWWLTASDSLFLFLTHAPACQLLTLISIVRAELVAFSSQRKTQYNERKMSWSWRGRVDRESGVTGEWKRWRERGTVPLESGPLVVNQSWQHLSLTLSPLCSHSPLIPLAARHHVRTPSHTHTLPCCPQPYLIPHLGQGFCCVGAQDKHQAGGTNRPLMWSDRTDN